MRIRILYLFFLIFYTTVIVSQEPVTIPETILIISENYNDVIKYYNKKMPDNYIIRSIYYNDKTDNKLILNQILEYHPSLIILFDDNTIINIFLKNLDFFSNRDVIYCSVYSDETLDELKYLNVNIKGISYSINYNDLNKLLKLFQDISILKTNSYTSSLLSSKFYENHKIRIYDYTIERLYNLRKTLLGLNDNELIVNLLISKIETYSTSDLSEEILEWGNNVVLDFNKNNYSIISLVPDYSYVSDKLINFTLNYKNNSIDSIKVQLKFNLNIKNLNSIKKLFIIKKIEKNIFEIIKND